ncbi:MAG: AEC family transporter [Eubacteriales bacterium]|nr:AEC family transporter [Eubacteriales bacterium]
MNNFLFSLNAVTPVFIIILLGVFLRRVNILNDNFADKASGLVFKVALPALLFRDISKTDFTAVFDGKLLFFALIGTLGSFLLLSVTVPFFIKNKSSVGAFIQGCFRSNFAFLGLPLIGSIFGSEAVSMAAVVLSLMMPVYNVLAVVLLTLTSPAEYTDRKKTALKIILNIVLNPLILAVVAAMPFSLSHISLPQVLSRSIGYMADFATPLALLCIGASMSMAGFRRNMKAGLAAMLIKIVLIPSIMVILAASSGFRDERLGIVFILFASPTAVASFIMAKAMGSDAELASNIVVTTTMFSALTIFAGTVLLKSAGLI